MIKTDTPKLTAEHTCNFMGNLRVSYRQIRNNTKLCTLYLQFHNSI